MKSARDTGVASAEPSEVARASRRSASHRALRRHLVLAGFAALGAGLVARAGYLQVFDHDFYRGQGDARQLRTVAIPAHRGNLLDRGGEPLAVSTPIQTLWGVPDKLAAQPAALREVAALLGADADALRRPLIEEVAPRGGASGGVATDSLTTADMPRGGAAPGE